MAEVRLVPATGEHAAAWAKWRSEPASQRYNPLNSAGLDELAQRLDSCATCLDDRSASEYHWMVEHEGTIIGMVGLMKPSWTMGYVEISYMLGEAYQGQGFGTRAVKLLVDKAFAETDLVRLYATISIENLASQKLVERLGFVREGLLREHYLIQGRRVDEVVYGLLRREWEPLPKKIASEE